MRCRRTWAASARSSSGAFLLHSLLRSIKEGHSHYSFRFLNHLDSRESDILLRYRQSRKAPDVIAVEVGLISKPDSGAFDSH